ncbi:MAG: Gfo/Idh/MocA family oxidoreductase [Verrucomicrobiae bacterium]|nr:Gfo/Idh/MocA family oxidoreductase [Verrucomicrobiae bacterium]MCP5538702.1 Gfo/Idh/MocA family oxidoreductase [Akkermansiaceae bacterium]
MNRSTRRQFLKSTAGAAVAPAILSASVLGTKARAAASERVTLGVIGVGGRGIADMESFLKHGDAQVVAVCDVDRLHYGKNAGRTGRPWGLESAQLIVDQHYGKEKESGAHKGCATHTDFRELCARDDLDAIVVATPDHWHALATLEALKSGRDVYCEKPVTHFFAEGQAVYREAAARQAIFQVGSQQRSSANFHQAVELILNGVIGRVKEVKVGLPKGHNEPDGDPALTDPPPTLDYDFWTGPSPMLPYTRARNHWSWRWHRAYGGGQLMDWIGHHNDISHWGLGMDKSGPLSVSVAGWTWPETDVYNSPVDYEVRCEYPGGIQVSIGSVNPMGTKWIGENGWVYVNRGALEASDPAWLAKDFKPGDKTAYRSPDHHRNFLDGVKTRTPCICPAETGHRSITPGHLAYVANDLKRETLKWDAAKEEIVGDAEAQAKLMALPYRAPWKLG